MKMTQFGICPVCPWASGRVIIDEEARIGDELNVTDAQSRFAVA